VLALQQRQRELLLLHVEGLTYRQIASRSGLPDAVVLRELVCAYCELRSKLSPGNLTRALESALRRSRSALP
jgi:DNA-directed RNA polymerase specialized sigma24 family protein